MVSVFVLVVSDLLKVDSSSELKLKRNNSALQLMTDAATSLERIRVLNLSHLLFEKSGDVEIQRQSEIERLGQLRTKLATVAEPSLLPSIDAFFAKAQSFIDLSDRTIDLSARGRKAEGFQWARAVVTPAYDLAGEQSARIRDEIERHNRASLDSIRQANRQVVFQLSISVLAGLALVVLMFLLGLRRVLAPVQRLTAAARRVSAGDYDVVVETAGRDEIGVMANAFNEMIRSQKKRINELHGLLEVSEVVTSSLELPTVLKWILMSGYLLGAEEGVVLIYGPDGMEVRAATNERLKPCKCAVSSCALPAAEDLRPQVITISARCGECTECLASNGFRSALAIPMRTHREMVGCLLFLTRQEGFTAHEVQLATIFGNQAAVAVENARLYSSLWQNYHNMIFGLAHAVDAKSEYTGRHSEQMFKYGELVGIKLGLLSADVEIVREGCLLHDVGKIGIREEILNKPGRLAAEEFEEIKKHPVIGADIIAPPVPKDRPTWAAGPVVRQDPAKYIRHLSLTVRHHHERFDGQGYPDGLKGEDIPLAARIVAVVDAFEAMTSDRPYRKAISPEDAIRELQRCAGTQFDPEVVEAFASVVVEHAEEANDGLDSLEESARARKNRPN